VRTPAGGDEVLAHRERGKDLPHLRHVADAGLRDAVRRRSRSSRPSKVTRPRTAGSMPSTLLNVVDLPMPLRPMSVMHWPASTAKSMPNSTWLEP
jgi:hypothetical protein